MKEKKIPTELDYQSAFDELQQIVRQLQEEVVGIDELTQKVRRASELQNFCKEKLRKIELELQKIEI